MLLSYIALLASLLDLLANFYIVYLIILSSNFYSYNTDKFSGSMTNSDLATDSPNDYNNLIFI